ncbi:MAG: hypothetical protein ACPGGK_10625 [Pikeienuella sp.]
MPTLVATFHNRVLLDQPASAVKDIMSDPDALLALIQPKDVALIPEGAGWRISSPGRLGQRRITIERAPDADDAIIYRSLSGGFEAFTKIKITKTPAVELGDGQMADPATNLTITVEVFAVTLKARLSAPLVRMAQRRINAAINKALARLAKRLPS